MAPPSFCPQDSGHPLTGISVTHKAQLSSRILISILHAQIQHRIVQRPSDQPFDTQIVDSLGRARRVVGRSFVPPLDQLVAHRQGRSLISSQFVQITSLAGERGGDVAHDVVGDALAVVGVDFVGGERGLPGGLVPDGPFLADGARLRGEVGACNGLVQSQDFMRKQLWRGSRTPPRLLACSIPFMKLANNFFPPHGGQEPSLSINSTPRTALRPLVIFAVRPAPPLRLIQAPQSLTDVSLPLRLQLVSKLRGTDRRTSQRPLVPRPLLPRRRDRLPDLGRIDIMPRAIVAERGMGRRDG